MVKRRVSHTEDELLPRKRTRPAVDQLSSLSDELTLRVLSTLSIKDLNLCQRVSRRLQNIATDSQLWKAAYYNRFVRPRLLRLPGRRHSATNSYNLSHTSKASKWLDEGHLVRHGRVVDWKRQYKVRHNWARGTCDVSQISVAARPPSPPLLAKLHNGIVYTVDAEAGLRAWSYKDEQKLQASETLHDGDEQAPRLLPTSFALDLQSQDPDKQWLVIGFDNGSFKIYHFQITEHTFHHSYTHPKSSNGTVTAVAITHPYVMCMTESQMLSLYKFDTWSAKAPSQRMLDPPLLSASLKSHTVSSPVSLSMRTAGSNIIASIAYAVPSILAGWSVGIQELQLSFQGDVLSSRTASAVAQGFSPLLFSPGLQMATPSRASSGGPSQRYGKPTSISYSHPYILVSHSDNTLTLYMAASTATALTIGTGRRLFGHTSSVCSAHVEGRGKAVSVGMQENDIRVWELEGTTLASSSRSRLSSDDFSVQLSPENRLPIPDRLTTGSGLIAQRGCSIDLISRADTDRSVTRGWVGFDEENLIVLREQGHGAQALTIYDFS